MWKFFCRNRSNQSSLINLCGPNCASAAPSAVGELASIIRGHTLSARKWMWILFSINLSVSHHGFFQGVAFNLIAGIFMEGNVILGKF